MSVSCGSLTRGNQAIAPADAFCRNTNAPRRGPLACITMHATRATPLFGAVVVAATSVRCAFLLTANNLKFHRHFFCPPSASARSVQSQCTHPYALFGKFSTCLCIHSDFPKPAACIHCQCSGPAAPVADSPRRMAHICSRTSPPKYLSRVALEVFADRIWYFSQEHYCVYCCGKD